jgi:hypothetical protein
MNGGTITGNTATTGAGVYVELFGTFDGTVVTTATGGGTYGTGSYTITGIIDGNFTDNLVIF